MLHYSLDEKLMVDGGETMTTKINIDEVVTDLFPIWAFIVIGLIVIWLWVASRAILRIDARLKKIES